MEALDLSQAPAAIFREASGQKNEALNACSNASAAGRRGGVEADVLTSCMTGEEEVFVAREKEEDDVSRERPFSLYTQLEVGTLWPSTVLFVPLLGVRSRLVGSRGRTGYARGRVSGGRGSGGLIALSGRGKVGVGGGRRDSR